MTEFTSHAYGPGVSGATRFTQQLIGAGNRLNQRAIALLSA